MQRKYIIKPAINNNMYYFRLTAENSETILQSEGYISTQSCHVGINSVKLNSTDDKNYNRLIANNGQYYFTLHAQNGKVIGMSEMYNTTAARDNGIESVKRNAPLATVVYMDK